jgi:hypothetical protein
VEEHESETKDKRVVKIQLPSDTYGNAPHHKDDPGKVNNPVIIDDAFYRLGSSEQFYKEQLKEKIYYEVVLQKIEGLRRHFGPYLVSGKPAKIGSRLKTSDVEDYLGIPHGGKEGPVCWNSQYPNGILMKHAYKNDVINIKKIVTQKKALPFWVGLSGGNPEVKGQTVVKASKVTSNCESGYFPMLQKMSKQNTALLDCALGNGTVTMFMVDTKEPNHCIYLGCYYLAGFATHKETIYNLRETAKQCPEYISRSEEMYTRFQERTHVRVQAIPYELPEDDDLHNWNKIVVEETDVFPIGIETKTAGEPSEILSLTQTKSVSFDEVVKTFIDKGVWRDLLEKEYDENDDVMRDDGIAPDKMVAGKEIQISMCDLLMIMVCVAVGVFCRVKRMNVVGHVVSPLRNTQSWMSKLGTIIQTFGTPHPGRGYDLTPLALILFSSSEGEGRGKRTGVGWMKQNPQEAKELMFASILATTTGRMGAFYQWSNIRRVIEPKSCIEFKGKAIFFPKLSEVGEFLEFLSQTCKDGKMGNFLSGQFRKSLPSCVESVVRYGDSIRHVAEDIDILYNRMTEKMENEKVVTKEMMVEIVQGFLKSRMGEGKNPAFLASQIVYNLDEMIDLIPRKKWENVVMGFGSKESMSWIKKNETDANMDILQEIWKAVVKLDEKKLQCLGLEKDKKLKNVFWKINQRYFDLHDCEHFMCKLWLIMVRKIGARPSKHPKLHRPHLHPLKAENMDVESFFGSLVQSIADKAIDTFQKYSMIKMPNAF